MTVGNKVIPLRTPHGKPRSGVKATSHGQMSAPNSSCGTPQCASALQRLLNQRQTHIDRVNESLEAANVLRTASQHYFETLARHEEQAAYIAAVSAHCAAIEQQRLFLECPSHDSALTEKFRTIERLENQLALAIKRRDVAEAVAAPYRDKGYADWVKLAPFDYPQVHCDIAKVQTRASEAARSLKQFLDKEGVQIPTSQSLKLQDERREHERRDAATQQTEPYLDRVLSLIQGSPSSTASTRECSSAISLVLSAQDQQWYALRVSGSHQFCREAWLEATARDWPIKGYQATDEDHHEARRRRDTAQHGLARIDGYLYNQLWFQRHITPNGRCYDILIFNKRRAIAGFSRLRGVALSLVVGNRNAKHIRDYADDVGLLRGHSLQSEDGISLSAHPLSRSTIQARGLGLAHAVETPLSFLHHSMMGNPQELEQVRTAAERAVMSHVQHVSVRQRILQTIASCVDSYRAMHLHGPPQG